METADLHQYINVLIHWAHNKNYQVEFTKNGDDAVCYISRIIEINSSLPLQTQIIRLLHECGHVLIFENDSVFRFKEKRDYPEKTQAHKVFTIIEEIEAWKRGKELASRLRIPMEDDIWEKAMVRAIYKYINWAGEKDVKDES